MFFCVYCIISNCFRLREIFKLRFRVGEICSLRFKFRKILKINQFKFRFRFREVCSFRFRFRKLLKINQFKFRFRFGEVCSFRFRFRKFFKINQSKTFTFQTIGLNNMTIKGIINNIQFDIFILQTGHTNQGRNSNLTLRFEPRLPPTFSII